MGGSSVCKDIFIFGPYHAKQNWQTRPVRVGAGDRSRHWIEAWSAAIRAAFKVRRLAACAVPRSLVLHILRLPLQAPGLLAISSNIRFLQVIFFESPQLTL
jgi:hypothetical protein